jgi:hypothetical protein
VHASEIERQRRITVLQDITNAEAIERKLRCDWASAAVEGEQKDRISRQFLDSLTSSNWFNEAISTYNTGENILY